MEERATPRWLDVLWLIFLGGLALLPPIREPHKQWILLAIGVFQLLEGRLMRGIGKRGNIYAVVVKIVLATVLINHTQDVPISSSYWPIFWLPVMTAATYFSPAGTLLWTGVASAAYVSNLIPIALSKEYEITWQNGWSVIVLRILFFFLVAMTVNRFVMEYRLHVQRYQELSQSLSEANRNLKQAQAEARRAERLAALGQLSAGLAHEIRNPLGVIKGSAELLNQKLAGSNPLSQELAGYIYTEVNRLSALVGRFLDFARPSRLDLRPEDLTSVMDKSLKAVEQQGASARVAVHRAYALELPHVLIDRELFEQAFTNLLLNACEAMGEIGGQLTVRVHRGRDGKEVIAEVEDSGPGVPPEMKEQIFNPFVTTKKDGVGLGLAIVSKIVDAHGGTLKLISLPGQGACFRVTLPASERG
jgi:two-component system, NtrC family, sensor histidine kinase HydH